jgi:hypothetical protein
MGGERDRPEKGKTRREALARELRANLLKRKAQARERKNVEANRSENGRKVPPS